MSDNIFGMIGIVIGGILGYLASFLNSRQERKWRLNSEFRSWKRDGIKQDFSSVMQLLHKFLELAHVFVEYHEGPDRELAKLLLDSTECVNDLRHEISEFSHAWQ